MIESHPMLHWALSTDGLLVLAATLLLAGAACVFSPSRALGPFVLVALLAWAAATPLAAAGAVTLRGGIAGASWLLVVFAGNAVVLGLLVAQGTGRPRIALASVALLALMPPAAFVAQVLLECHVGHYCPGL